MCDAPLEDIVERVRACATRKPGALEVRLGQRCNPWLPRDGAGIGAGEEGTWWVHIGI